jgi:hypothetical protein
MARQHRQSQNTFATVFATVWLVRPKRNPSAEKLHFINKIKGFDAFCVTGENPLKTPKVKT